MNLPGFMRTRIFCLVLVAVFCAASARAQDDAEVKAHYVKSEQMITMRDGVKLFTSIYVPKDTSKKYPIMLHRTPYSVAPYGPDLYKTALGPSPVFQNERFIFVYQDVRGRLMSEGEYVNMRPHNPKKAGAQDIDESTQV